MRGQGCEGGLRAAPGLLFWGTRATLELVLTLTLTLTLVWPARALAQTLPWKVVWGLAFGPRQRAWGLAGRGRRWR